MYQDRRNQRCNRTPPPKIFWYKSIKRPFITACPHPLRFANLPKALSMYVRPSRCRSAGGLFHVVARRSAGILLGDYQNCMQEGNKKAGALQRCKGRGSQSLQLGSTRTAAVNRFCSATSLNTQVSTRCARRLRLTRCQPSPSLCALLLPALGFEKKASHSISC